MATVTEETKVSQTQVNLDEILGLPGGDNITVPEDKPNLFSRKRADLKFVDEPNAGEEKKKEGEEQPDAQVEAVKNKEKAKTGEDIVAEVTDPEKNKKKDTPASTSTIDALKSMIKAGKIIPFEDEKPIEQYTSKDIEELLEANFQERDRKVSQEFPKQFFESLPEEFQVAADYFGKGGRDVKGILRAILQSEEITSLDVKDPKNHEAIVRQYLQATNYGTADEIDEEIGSLKDRNELEKKAGQFKPKLEKMSEAIVAQKLASQEQMQKQQADVARAYVDSIYKVLEPGELNGIKLDRKTQNLLYTGLISPNYPSISGRATNLLGHLLEKYQYVEPNHGLIAEALWLLSDPDGYRSKLREQGKNGNVEETVRKLKTEQGNRGSSSPVVEREETTQKRLPREHNFFKR